jgi:hypothetical protein
LAAIARFRRGSDPLNCSLLLRNSGAPVLCAGPRSGGSLGEIGNGTAFCAFFVFYPKHCQKMPMSIKQHARADFPAIPTLAIGIPDLNLYA